MARVYTGGCTAWPRVRFCTGDDLGRGFQHIRVRIPWHLQPTRSIQLEVVCSLVAMPSAQDAGCPSRACGFVGANAAEPGGRGASLLQRKLCTQIQYSISHYRGCCFKGHSSLAQVDKAMPVYWIVLCLFMLLEDCGIAGTSRH
jgi:hypothetical protein